MQEEGCDFMHLVQADEEGDTWVMLEKFGSRAAWDEHMETQHNKGGNRALEDLLRQPSELRLYQEKLPA